MVDNFQTTAELHRLWYFFILALIFFFFQVLCFISKDARMQSVFVMEFSQTLHLAIIVTESQSILKNTE